MIECVKLIHLFIPTFISLFLFEVFCIKFKEKIYRQNKSNDNKSQPDMVIFIKLC